MSHLFSLLSFVIIVVIVGCGKYAGGFQPKQVLDGSCGKCDISLSDRSTDIGTCRSHWYMDDPKFGSDRLKHVE